MTRAEFVKTCAIALTTCAAAVGYPQVVPVDRRPHGDVKGTWCGCYVCEEWDEALEERVRVSVSTAMQLFWHAIRAEYPFLPEHPACMEHVLGDDLVETGTDLVCQMIENEMAV